MGNSNSWAIDHESAHRFLALLGKDPATTRLRAFPHRDHPRRREIGARKGVWNLRQAERWGRQGRGVYVVINDGGDRNSAIQRCRALFVEWDDQPIAWQAEAWRELGLPEPSLIVASGGRSLHCYWVLREPLAPGEWRPLQRELIEKAQGDRSCCDLARVMRLPGSWYLDAQGQPLARASIEAASGRCYGADELAAALLACRGLAEQGEIAMPALRGRGDNHLETAAASDSPLAPVAPLGPLPLLPPAKHPTARTDMTSPAPSAPTWADICSALAAIPPRVAGSNTYGVYRNILWGLISATEEAGHQKEEAIALMEAHSPSGESGWDVRQVASSGGEEIGAATFWFHARRCGWRPEGEQGTRRPPGRHRPQLSSTAGGASGPRPGPKSLPLHRRLDALEHCIRALLGRETSSIRRQAQVRRAQEALELRALLRHQEIGQLILEAHDRRHGVRRQ